jgi:hypothetical protein
MDEFIPYTYHDTLQLMPTSASADRQLGRAPWPLNQYWELESLTITNSDGSASGGQIVLWDQDLTNTTPSTRGSAGGYLAAFGVGAAAASGVASTTIVYNQEGNAPRPKFYAGIAMQASRLNILVSAKVRVRR